MVRTGSLLALLASLALAMGLVARIRQERYAGPVEYVYPDRFTFETVEGTHPIREDFQLRELPATVPAELEAHLTGIKSREWIGLSVIPPAVLRDRIVKNAPAEFRHDHLDLPIIGLVLERTTVKVGDAEWRHGHGWLLWGTVGGLALLPLAAWSVLSIPILLLRKRPRPQT